MTRQTSTRTIGARWEAALLLALFAIFAAIPASASPDLPAQEETAAEAELYTNVYVVPPTFTQAFQGIDNPFTPNDPFASPDVALTPDPVKRHNAREILESYGISFPAGTSALYNPQTSQLIVRQTLDQMNLVEAVIESLMRPVEKQILIEYHLIESNLPLFPASERKATPSPVDPDSGARIAGAERSDQPIPRIPIAASLTPEQHAQLLQRLEKEKLGKVRSAPKLLCRSGQRAEVWVADAFTEIDPVLGADSFSIDLNLRTFLGQAEGLQRKQPQGSSHVTLWGGHSVAIEEAAASGGFRTRLITATVVDPAGIPVTEPQPMRQAVRSYLVPPDFLSSGDSNKESPTAQDILESVGITFGAKSLAAYNPSTSILIVRNTPDQLELVEAYVESFTQSQPLKQIHFAIKEVVLDASDAGDPMAWILPKQSSMPPIGKNGGNTPPASSGIAGVFTDPQFQMVIRALNQRKDAELLSAPSILTRSGQPGLVEVNERRWGLRGTVGADEFTIDIDLYLPAPGEKWIEDGKIIEAPRASVTVWDGQTIAYTEPAEDGKKTRVIFLTGRLIDPAGVPIHPVEVELPQEEPEFTIEQQQAVARADESALRGSQLKADGELRQAEEQYIHSLRALPLHPVTEGRREAYLQQLLSLWEELRAQGGFPADDPRGPSLFPDATPPLEPEPAFVLGNDEKLIVHTVAKGDTLFQIAKQYQSSLARIQSVNRMESEHFRVGDHLIVPIPLEVWDAQAEPSLPKWETPVKAAPAHKSASLIIPTLEFRDTPLKDAIDFLRKISAELDTDSPEKERGLNFILKDAEPLSRVRITLKLSNVPLIEAIRYTAALANCDYRVEGDTVTISQAPIRQPATASATEEAEKDSPEDLWFRAYQALKKGETAEQAKKAAEARHAFLEAEKGFTAVAEKYPDFHPDLVKERLRLLREKLQKSSDKD